MSSFSHISVLLEAGTAPATNQSAISIEFQKTSFVVCYERVCVCVLIFHLNPDSTHSSTWIRLYDGKGFFHHPLLFTIWPKREKTIQWQKNNTKFKVIVCCIHNIYHILGNPSDQAARNWCLITVFACAIVFYSLRKWHSVFSLYSSQLLTDFNTFPLKNSLCLRRWHGFWSSSWLADCRVRNVNAKLMACFDW